MQIKDVSARSGEVLSLLLVTAVLGACWPAAAQAGMVRVVYLSPSDRAYNPEYEARLEEAVLDLQAWLAGQTGGYSFELGGDVVEWYSTPHNAAWYRGPDVGYDIYDFWYRAIDDGFAATGGSWGDPLNRYLFYLDADNRVDQPTGGATPVALFPANDLRGLSGEPLWNQGTGQWEEFAGSPGRWAGGMGHELGHILGAGHPLDEQLLDDGQYRSLMYMGYANYPDTWLTQEQKQTLIGSGFLTPIPEPASLLVLMLAVTGLMVRRERRS